MSNFSLKKIITEEVNKFDFLGNDEYLISQEINTLLQTEELQKQLICDSLLDKTNKLKQLKIVEQSISEVTDETTNISLQYIIDMEYKYDSTKESLKFNLEFRGENINVDVNSTHNNGSYDEQPSDNSWYDHFNWEDIEVIIYNMDGEELEFKAFNNAPLNIQRLFIRKFLEYFITSNSFEIRTPEIKDNIQNSDYC